MKARKSLLSQGTLVIPTERIAIPKQGSPREGENLYIDNYSCTARAEQIRDQVHRFKLMSKVDTKRHISMDDFHEMHMIEQEFGAIPMGDDEDRKKQKLKQKVNIYGVEKEQQPHSHWNLLARHIDSTPAKFARFLKCIKKAQLVNIMQLEEARNKHLSDMLDQKIHSKQQLKEFVQFAKQGKTLSDAQIKEMILTKNIRAESNYIQEIKKHMERIDDRYTQDQARVTSVKKKLNMCDQTRREQMMTVPKQSPRIDSHWSKKRWNVFFNRGRKKRLTDYFSDQKQLVEQVESRNKVSKKLCETSQTIQPNKNELISDLVLADMHRSPRNHQPQHVRVSQRGDQLSSVTSSQISQNPSVKPKIASFTTISHREACSAFSTITPKVVSSQTARSSNYMSQGPQQTICIQLKQILTKLDAEIARIDNKKYVTSPRVDSILKDRAVVLASIMFALESKWYAIDSASLEQIQSKYDQCQDSKTCTLLIKQMATKHSSSVISQQAAETTAINKFNSQSTLQSNNQDLIDEPVTPHSDLFKKTKTPLSQVRYTAKARKMQETVPLFERMNEQQLQQLYCRDMVAVPKRRTHTANQRAARPKYNQSQDLLKV